MQPQTTSEAQRIARLQAMHRRLLDAAERLTADMVWMGQRAYEADPAAVLALKAAVRESGKLFPRRHERNS